MKIYIAGPMRGLHDLNKSSFDDAEVHLKKRDWTVYNPSAKEYHVSRKFHSEGLTAMEFKQLIIRDCIGLIKSDAIYMLVGWEKSIGAKAEHAIAVWASLVIIYQGSGLRTRLKKTGEE